MFLSEFDGDVRAIADVEAFGAVLAAPEHRVQLFTRHRSGTAAHLFPPDRLPAALTSPPDAATIVTPLSSRFDPADAVTRRLAMYGIECLLLLPLPDGMGLLWIGKSGLAPFTGEQVGAFERFAPRLAAAARQPESLDVRLARLARIDEVEQILPVIAGALDVRDVFHRLSDVARSVMPHDGATVQLLEGDRLHTRLHALDGIGREHVPEIFSTNYAPIFNEHFQYSIHDDLLASPNERERPAAKAGLRSALRLPLRFDGQVGGAMEFSSSTAGRYREMDVPVARRIADYVTLAIAHQRMADEGRRAAELRERSQNLRTLDDLLATVSGVLDIREVFDRVSVIAQQVLAHDAMGVTTILEHEGRIRVHALSGFGDDFPPSFEAPLPEPELLNEPWEFRIIDDMAANPRYAGSPTVRAGMQSVLGLPVRLEGRLYGGVNFYSRAKARFTRDDVLAGQRIADHVTLALSHQRLAEEARSSAELTARTANLELLDELLATLTDTGELTDLFDRVSALARKVLPHDGLSMSVVLPDGR